jgi:hypothetical protein
MGNRAFCTPGATAKHRRVVLDMYLLQMAWKDNDIFEIPYRLESP